MLRPQPRGMHASKGPLKDITLHDLARDVATVIERENAGPAVIVGHAYGNWVARMTAVDHPKLVRGVVLAAAAAKKFPPRLSQLVSKSADQSVPEAERLAAMQEIFFASGNDPKIWLKGWWKEASEAQRVAAANVKQSDWWHAGTRTAVRLAGRHRPVQAEGHRERTEGRVSRPRDGRGDPECEPRAAAGAAGRGGAGDRRVGEEAMTLLSSLPTPALSRGRTGMTTIPRQPCSSAPRSR